MPLMPGESAAPPISSGTRSRFRGSSSSKQQQTSIGAMEAGTLQAVQGQVGIHGQFNSVASSDREDDPTFVIEERYDYGEIISALSNLSIQYNLGVIAPALLLLDHSRITGDEHHNNDALYPRTNEQDSMLKSAVFLGAIVGQCTMGFIGDALFGSLSLAMMFTNFIALVGTCGCAFAPLLGGGDYQRAQNVYITLAIFRAIMGIGVGGKYPLGSAIRAEAAESDSEHPDKREHRAKEVAKGFFWQTPGAILPYLVALILLLVIGDEHSAVGRKYATTTFIQYILLVGAGVIPSMLILVLSWKQLPVPARTRESGRDRTCHFASICSRIRNLKEGYNKIDKGQQNPVIVALRNKAYWNKLVGTSLSWLLYDFVYYGTAFNQPEILSTVLGDTEGLIGVSWRDAIVAMMGIPGVVLAIRMMEEPLGGPKPLQAWGFVAIAGACFLLLCFYGGGDYVGPTMSKWGGFLSCAILTCALNWGCNVSTYVLPMEVFPKEIRSSFHGLSAGTGKLGALFGSVLFTQLNSISVSLTFMACIISCLLGIVVTWRFIDPPKRETFFVERLSRQHSQEEEEMAIIGNSQELVVDYLRS